MHDFYTFISLLTKLENAGPFCLLLHSPGGVNRASGRGSAPPAAGGVTTSVPIALKSESFKSFEQIVYYMLVVIAS